MTLKQLGVRIPDTLHGYLKHKSQLSGVKLQQLITMIIAEYQQNDTEYKEALNRLAAEFKQSQDEQGGNHDV